MFSSLKGRVEPDSRGSTPTQDNGHYPAVVTSNSSLPNLLNVSHKLQEPPPPGEGPPLIMPGPGGPPPPPGAGSAGQARMRCQSFDGMAVLLLVGGVGGGGAGMNAHVFLKEFLSGATLLFSFLGQIAEIYRAEFRTWVDVFAS